MSGKILDLFYKTEATPKSLGGGSNVDIYSLKCEPRHIPPLFYNRILEEIDYKINFAAFYTKTCGGKNVTQKNVGISRPLGEFLFGTPIATQIDVKGDAIQNNINSDAYQEKAQKTLQISIGGDANQHSVREIARQEQIRGNAMQQYCNKAFQLFVRGNAFQSDIQDIASQISIRGNATQENIKGCAYMDNIKGDGWMNNIKVAGIGKIDGNLTLGNIETLKTTADSRAKHLKIFGKIGNFEGDDFDIQSFEIEKYKGKLPELPEELINILKKKSKE